MGQNQVMAAVRRLGSGASRCRAPSRLKALALEKSGVPGLGGFQICADGCTKLISKNDENGRKITKFDKKPLKIGVLGIFAAKRQ